MTDRAVSVTLDYILMLMIATVLLASVVTASGIIIDQQVERSVENELLTTGEALAGDIQNVERIVNSSDEKATTLVLEIELPRHVSGEQYYVSINASKGEIVLVSPNPDIEVTVPVASDRLNATSEDISGGPVIIEAVDGSIEVRSA